MRIESDGTFKHGHNCLMRNISLTRQSNLSWHFSTYLSNCEGHPESSLCGYYHSVCALTRSCFYVHRGAQTDFHWWIRHNQHRTGHTWKLYKMHCWSMSWGFGSLLRDFWAILRLINTGWTIPWSFTLRSFNCVFTILADSWSLKGITTQVVFSVIDLDCNKDWSATLTFTFTSTKRTLLSLVFSSIYIYLNHCWLI